MLLESHQHWKLQELSSLADMRNLTHNLGFLLPCVEIDLIPLEGLLRRLLYGIRC